MRQLICALVLAGAPTVAAAETSIFDLKNSLVQFALEQISTPDEFVVTAEGVEEPGDGVTDLVGVKIADGEGVWLTAERLSMRWSASGLLNGRLEINRLAATEVRVLRAPEPAGVDIELKEESAFAQGDGDPFDWPRSPIALLVEELALEDVVIAEGVLSPASVAFDATGSARDEGAEQALSLTVERTDAIAGDIALSYVRDFEAETLRLSLAAQEQAGGLVAALAGLPEDSASRLSVEADGPLTEWRVDFDASADRVFEAAGRAGVSNAERLQVVADFTLTPGPAMDPTVAAAIAPRARLVFRAVEGENGVVAIEEGALRAADLDLTLNGIYSRPEAVTALALELEARAGLSDLVEGVAFDRLGFEGTLRGRIDEFTAEGLLSLAGVETAAADLGASRLKATVGYAGERVDFDLIGEAEGVRLDKIPADAIGRAELTARGVYQADRLELAELALGSPLLSARADGAVDFGREAVRLDLALDAPELTPVAAAYGANASGVLAAETAVAGSLDAPELSGSAVLSELRVDGEAFGGVTADYALTLDAAPNGAVDIRADGSRFGAARARTDLELRDGRLALSQLRLDALGAALRGDLDVLLEPGLIDGAAELSLPDLRTLRPVTDEQVSGAASGRVVFAAAEGRQGVAADLALRDVAGFGARIASIDAALSAEDAFGAPRLAIDLDATRLSSGDVALPSLSFDATGPLSRVSLALETEGAVRADALSFRSEGVLDAAGADVALDLSAADLRYGAERVALSRPLPIRFAGGATRLTDIGLDLPGGALTGAATIFANGMEGDLALRMADVSVLARLGLAPLERGGLEASARFDTRPARAGGRLDLAGRRLEFEGAFDGEAALDLEATGAWDGRRAEATAVLSGDFGEPFRVTAAAPLVARGALLPVTPAGAPLSGTATWRGDIGALWALAPVPDHVLDGDLALDLALGGTVDAPEVSGDVTLDDGRYENLDFGAILTKLTARSQVAADGGFRIDLRAEDGAGAPVAGAVALSRGILDAEIRSENAVLVRRDDVTAAVTLDIAASGPVAAPDVVGSVQVDRAEIRLVGAGAPTVPDLGDVRVKGAPPPPPAESADETGGALDLTIAAPDDVFIRGRGLDSEWGLDLKVDGTTRRPRVTGVVEKIRGQLSLLGAPFELDRGRIQFTGATPVDPLIDVALTRENDGLRGGPVITGTASAPEIGFTSQPPAPEEDVLPRLLFGSGRQELSPVEALQLANGLATLLNGGGGVVDSVREAAGLDVLRVDQQDESTGVVAGRDVAEDVFVGVRQPVDGGSPSVQVEIEVFDNVILDSEVGPDRGSSLGLNWRKDF